MSHPTISLEDIQDGFEKNLAGKLTDKQKGDLNRCAYDAIHFESSDLVQYVETLLKETLDMQRALIKKSE